MPNLVDLLPQGPGVYLFKDDTGRVLYVGKAKDLRKRLMAYLRPSGELSHKTSLMIKRAKGLDFILTASEKEALILESTLIKKHLPRYNIVLRDDSQYPCLRLSVMDEFPRLSIARRIKRDGARYFGPFSSAGAVRNTLKVIDKVFQLRKCKGTEVKKRERPCLNYQMGRCFAPCAGKISSQEYRDIVNQVILFLEGRNKELIAELNRKMEKAAEELEFEQAARIRDQIHAIEKTIERQHVVSTKLKDQDVIGLAKSEGFFVVVVLSIRNGYLISSRDYSLRTRGETPNEVMEAFIKQYYMKGGFVPKEILLSDAVEDEASITEWLSEVAKTKVSIKVPKKGEKRRLVDMAISNAQNVLKFKEVSGEIRLAENIKDALELPIIPRHIEAVDISNLYGNLAVGTIVGFVDGKADKSLYRNYRIQTVEGIDDYAMIAEVAQRRMAQGNLPDLFLIDGGRGQLGAVKEVLDRHRAPERPVVVALAKADYKKGEVVDKIYVENRREPVMLKPNDPVLLFLMRIRDEVHRRAIGYHRKIRRKGLTASVLLEIPGIGRKRAQRLLQRFPSLEHIKHASTEDLIKVGGMSVSVAERIKRFFEEDK
ncbi:MAG: excinuclease ABC subunit C [Deltaproteobacteria bacterium]|nr:MAG: excinuclease ABC subunit C [Deltaproteobacteria bacterium]